MADDNFQNRPGNPNRGPTVSEQSNDPLAELARLIGQNDPFSDFNRTQPPPVQPQQRSMPNEPPRAPQHISVLPEYPPAPGAYRAAPEPPQHSQAPHATGDYHDFNQAPPGNDFYDEPEPRARGRGMMTAMAVIALAVVGIVGAFGYRIVAGGPSVSSPPPAIPASRDPVKVPPPASTNEASQTKLPDRVGDRSQNERIVAREEPPVDAKDLNRPTAARNAPPLPGSLNLPPTPSTAAVPPTSSMAWSEPKKVRTVPIRPDAAQEASMASATLTPPSGATPPNVPAARVTATPSPPPVITSQARVPQAAPPPIQPSNAPLSLGDETSPALPRTSSPPPPPRQAPPQRQTSAPPQQPAAPPQPVPQRQVAVTPAQVATAPSGSGFLVQVSSQKSESEAQTALRAAIAKYPSVLSGQKGSIQRADLGERGTFYRAMVGPFASREQAAQLCTSLKAAGGTCIVAGH